jgi:pimeloyl-ACP methyl ester carboxylesterase
MKTISFFILSFFAIKASFAQTLQHKADWMTAVDGTKIYYEVTGTGSPVILIHGFIVNSESWKKTMLLNDLLNEGYQVITLDLRGNGKSDKPHTEAAYINDAEAKDIMKLADVLKLKKYSVVGYSRGAIIASRVLVLDKRLVGCVIGGMGSDFTNPEWHRRILFYEELSGKKEVKALEGLIKYIQDTGLDREALALMQFGQPSTSKDEFSAVKKHVLVICGTEDDDNGSAKALSEMIPHSIFATVPGNHNNASHSKEFSEEVLKYLHKVTR